MLLLLLRIFSAILTRVFITVCYFIFFGTQHREMFMKFCLCSKYTLETIISVWINESTFLKYLFCVLFTCNYSLTASQVKTSDSKRILCVNKTWRIVFI